MAQSEVYAYDAARRTPAHFPAALSWAEIRVAEALQDDQALCVLVAGRSPLISAPSLAELGEGAVSNKTVPQREPEDRCLQSRFNSGLRARWIIQRSEF